MSFNCSPRFSAADSNQSPHRHAPVPPAPGLRPPLPRPAAPGAGRQTAPAPASRPSRACRWIQLPKAASSPSHPVPRLPSASASPFATPDSQIIIPCSVPRHRTPVLRRHIWLAGGQSNNSGRHVNCTQIAQAATGGDLEDGDGMGARGQGVEIGSVVAESHIKRGAAG